MCIHVCTVMFSNNNCCKVHSNLLIHLAKMADCCIRDCNLMTRQMTLDDIFFVNDEKKTFRVYSA